MADIVKFGTPALQPHQPRHKTVKSRHGHYVHVAHTLLLSRQGVHEMHIYAKCGQIILHKTITTGPDEIGKQHHAELPTLEQLQNRIDEKKQDMADQASYKEHVRILAENIV